jgi:hypothetical protein
MQESTHTWMDSGTTMNVSKQRSGLGHEAGALHTQTASSRTGKEPTARTIGCSVWHLVIKTPGKPTHANCTSPDSWPDVKHTCLFCESRNALLMYGWHILWYAGIIKRQSMQAGSAAKIPTSTTAGQGETVNPGNISPPNLRGKHYVCRPRFRKTRRTSADKGGSVETLQVHILINTFLFCACVG